MPPRFRNDRREEQPQVRIPPYSMEAERAVLGALLLAPEKTFELLSGLRCAPEWFYVEAHRTVYETARTLYEQKALGVDAVTVISALQEAGELDKVGGAAAVERLTEGEIVIAHAEYYADILRQKFVLRQISDAAASAIEKCYAPDRSTSAILSETQEAMFAISEKEDTAQPTWDQSLTATFSKIDHLPSHSTGLNGLSTGFKDLDQVIQVPCDLAEFSVKAITRGIDAIGEVTVRVTASDGRSFTGRGSDNDIIVSSAKAYVNAINRMIEASRDRV